MYIDGVNGVNSVDGVNSAGSKALLAYFMARGESKEPVVSRHESPRNRIETHNLAARGRKLRQTSYDMAL